MLLYDERNNTWKERFNLQTEKKLTNTGSDKEAPQKAGEKFLQEEGEREEKSSVLLNGKPCISA